MSKESIKIETIRKALILMDDYCPSDLGFKKTRCGNDFSCVRCWAEALELDIAISDLVEEE